MTDRENTTENTTEMAHLMTVLGLVDLAEQRATRRRVALSVLIVLLMVLGVLCTQFVVLPLAGDSLVRVLALSLAWGAVLWYGSAWLRRRAMRWVGNDLYEHTRSLMNQHMEQRRAARATVVPLEAITLPWVGSDLMSGDQELNEAYRGAYLTAQELNQLLDEIGEELKDILPGVEERES